MSRVNKAVDKQSDVKVYVKKLEQRYDVASLESEEMPSGKAMITEIEEYLRSQKPSRCPRMTPTNQRIDQTMLESRVVTHSRFGLRQ